MRIGNAGLDLEAMFGITPGGADKGVGFVGSRGVAETSDAVEAGGETSELSGDAVLSEAEFSVRCSSSASVMSRTRRCTGR